MVIINTTKTLDRLNTITSTYRLYTTSLQYKNKGDFCLDLK